MTANDPMTLPELLQKFEEMTPHLEERAADIIRHNKAWVLRPDEDPLAVVRSGGYAALLGMGIMDFLCWAFDEGDKGYVPADGLRR